MATTDLGSSATGLADVCRYSLSTGGKRIRPVLVVAAADMLRLPVEQVKPFALAVEFLHTFSLIHDDLPCMDNDTLRRGVPTCHVKFGEDAALLAGDALLAFAFQALTSVDYVPDHVIRSWLVLLSSTARDLCEGQMLDVRPALEAVATRDFLEQKHLKKTASLITASVAGAAVLLSHEDDRKRVGEKLSAYGRSLGLLFQVTDDLLEAAESKEKAGEGSADERQGRLTYASYYGLERGALIAEQLAEEAQLQLSEFGPEADFLRYFARYVQNRTL